MSPDAASDVRNLEHRVARLAAERTALFETAAVSFGLSRDARARLGAIERELDECFLTRRTQRALVDARRFNDDRSLLRHTALRRREP
jgi:hypothetical protein